MCRVVPVARRVNVKAGVDADRYDVLILVTRLERRQQNRTISSLGGIVHSSRVRAGEALVIGDVSHVEAGRGVPRAVALRRESFVGVR